MTYSVTFADLQEQDVAVAADHIGVDDIPDFLSTAFTEVVGEAQTQGVALAGPPFARYHLDESGTFGVRAGFPVGSPLASTTRVHAERLPGGRVARTLHRGPYSEAAAAYDAATTFVLDNGFEVCGDPWEVYLDGPETPTPRTEVFVPCRPVHGTGDTQDAG